MTTDDLSDQNRINYVDTVGNIGTLEQNYTSECCYYNMKGITFWHVSQT